MLTLDIAKGDGSQAVDWTKFFDRSSRFRLLYTIQIVQAVLEDGHGGPAPVSILNARDFPGHQALERQQQQTQEDDEPTIEKSGSQLGVSPKEDEQLRAQWAEEFLAQGGFQHILGVFMQC